MQEPSPSSYGAGAGAYQGVSLFFVRAAMLLCAVTLLIGGWLLWGWDVEGRWYIRGLSLLSFWFGLSAVLLLPLSLLSSPDEARGMSHESQQPLKDFLSGLSRRLHAPVILLSHVGGTLVWRVLEGFDSPVNTQAALSRVLDRLGEGRNGQFLCKLVVDDDDAYLVLATPFHTAGGTLCLLVSLHDVEGGLPAGAFEMSAAAAARLGKRLDDLELPPFSPVEDCSAHPDRWITRCRVCSGSMSSGLVPRAGLSQSCLLDQRHRAQVICAAAQPCRF